MDTKFHHNLFLYKYIVLHEHSKFFDSFSSYNTNNLCLRKNYQGFIIILHQVPIHYHLNVTFIGNYFVYLIYFSYCIFFATNFSKIENL